MFTKKRLLATTLVGVIIIAITSMVFIKSSKENVVVTTASNKTVLAFTTYYYPEDKSSYNQMVENTSSINNIATDTYTIDTKGNLSGNVPKEQIEYANDNKIKPLAMITNKFNADLAKALLESPNNRKLLIQNILNTLKTNNYKGVNIDFENIYYYDRDSYTSFLKELYGELNPEGFTVTASVPAKTSENLKDSWSGAYDYKEIAKYADQVVIMTYDEHSPSGTSGAIASINWVKTVVKYASSVVPASKIVLGVGSYGYDWSSKGVKAYGIDAIYKLAETNNAEIQWDDLSKSPFFKYKDDSGINHTVWFENSTSLSYKLDIVNDNNLAGIAIWRLGLENADYWSTIKAKLSK
ncbi:glycosyl hydrolase family 18 protein [Clostridium magnum]|uniref:Putative sporulation-specific glycosylase YdhD n=1 Tax=Clostridium magnum DSM 2767 TaxID=1121326 RepID=A0A161XE23_9CLOT|nr:glycosyl hydrolase family 18 protein [Clostridium magnum]KZL92616.1 putative sporulation-specific glycosylase YdhD [Clostridium magnum DSM 2767]SHJ07062.1 Spore germination protein YaaH [Clostridium magnum DSM 2767]